MSEEASRKLGETIHFDSIVVDCHNDTMMKCVDQEDDPLIDIGEETELALDLDKAEKGGLNLACFAAFTPRRESEDEANHKILSLINALYWNEERNRERMELVRSVEDIDRIVAEGKLAALATIEGAYSLNEDNYRRLLEQYHDLGIRILAYVWNQENKLGAGTEGPDSMGLTDLGIELTKEMNRLGILIDVSHMNKQTFWDTIEHSKSPIIASHSCASGLVDHVRNLDDDQLLALKENGGMVNINYWWELLARPKKEANIEKLVDHIDYIVDLIGIDHVGLGSDFDGASLPSDLETAIDLPKISQELAARAYSREDIEKILGLNNLRLFKEIEESSSYSLDNDIELDFNFSQGEKIANQKDLRATIETEILDSHRIIVDGLEEESIYKDGEIYLARELELYKGYHLISFELEREGRVTRRTRIFKYI